MQPGLPSRRRRSRDRQRLDPYVRRVGLVTVLGSVMSVLDTTIVNVALDSLGAQAAHQHRHDPVGGHRLPARRSPRRCR